jgi:hypothetical protein
MTRCCGLCSHYKAGACRWRGRNQPKDWTQGSRCWFFDKDYSAYVLRSEAQARAFLQGDQT